MMGPPHVVQGALFYVFTIEEFVPTDHPLRSSPITGAILQHPRPSFD